LNHSYNIKAAGRKYENTVHGIFGAHIKQYEDRTLLNFGGLDEGFYYAADVLPVNRYFCGLNNYPVRSAKDQMQVLENESVHFVVTANHPLEVKLERAKELMPSYEFKDINYELVMNMAQYYLYQRINVGD